MEKFRFTKKSDDMLGAILALKNVKEARNFFRDLLTIDEIREMTERWEIVRLLEKDVPYRDISKKLKVSTTTVSRVANWYFNGMGGYKLILDRMNKKHHRASSRTRKRLN